MSRSKIFVKLLLVCLSASAAAETRFCIGGNLDDLNPAEVAVCKNKISELRDAVKRHGAPAGWHFVMVCDEAGWQEYASFVEQEKSRLMNASFRTDAEQHLTVVRASRLESSSQGEADLFLKAAMDGLPVRQAAPKLIPNQKKMLSQPELETAHAETPLPSGTSGQ